MKKVFLKKACLIISLSILGNIQIGAQTPSGCAFFDSPGNNSCHAGVVEYYCGTAMFSFPIPTGLTLSQINYLGTDYRDNEQDRIDFSVTVQCPGGQMTFHLYTCCSNSTWMNSGNLATGNSYANLQATYGSCLVSSITLSASSNWVRMFFDNTIINNRLYNYDDCDGDGLLDIFDCAPDNNGNNKVLVCHSGNTICVAQPALQAHLNHGDFMGSCSGNARPANNLPPEEVSKNEIKLYPNPANNQINIRNYNNKPLGTVSIYDILGEMVYKNIIGSSRAIIDIKKFSPGVYYLRSDQMEKALKFVKQ